MPHIHEPVLRLAYLIRKVEICFLQLALDKKLIGTTHTCLGQEINAAAFFDLWNEGDFVFSGHRGHGHYLSRSLFNKDESEQKNEIVSFMLEVLGHFKGKNEGLAGTQHISNFSFLSHGILGDTWPLAVGRAFGMKKAEDESIVILFSGEGALGKGIVYESLNIMALWETPLLVIIENNDRSQSTISEKMRSGTICDRINAFNVEYRCSDSNEPIQILQDVKRAVHQVRTSRKPFVLEIKSELLAPHSTCKNFDEMKKTLNGLSDDKLEKIFKRVDSSTLKKWNDYIESCFKEVFQIISSSTNEIANSQLDFRERTAELDLVECKRNNDLGVRRINRELEECLKDEDTWLLGEDILDPYGGAFKVTQGLSTKFPMRVIGTPISEEALVAISIGMAMSGRKPILEIMFGDFIASALNGILNLASKIPYLSNNKLKAGFVLRTAMGGGRGYGATHSQSLEKHFLGIPHVVMVVPNEKSSLAGFYQYLINLQVPVLVIEYKDLYSSVFRDNPEGFIWKMSQDSFPVNYLIPKSRQCKGALIGYGPALKIMEEAAEQLFQKHDIVVSIICPTLISSFDLDWLKHDELKFSKVEIVVTVEMGSITGGWGAEVIARIGQSAEQAMRYERVGSLDQVIPASSTMEEKAMPTVEKIVQAVLGNSQMIMKDRVDEA